jgi:hypothetical protein
MLVNFISYFPEVDACKKFVLQIVKLKWLGKLFGTSEEPPKG